MTSTFNGTLDLGYTPNKSLSPSKTIRRSGYGMRSIKFSKDNSNIKVDVKLTTTGHHAIQSDPMLSSFFTARKSIQGGGDFSPCSAESNNQFATANQFFRPQYQRSVKPPLHFIQHYKLARGRPSIFIQQKLQSQKSEESNNPSLAKIYNFSIQDLSRTSTNP
jgi:hypothetical protein